MTRRRIKLKSNKLLKIFFLFFIILFILFYLLLRSNFFTIKQIEIKKEKVDCATEQQIRNSTNLLGENFFLINTKNLIKNLQTKFICIKDINLARLLPDKVKLEVIGREGVALLVSLKNQEASLSSTENIATPSADLENSFIVDNEGFVFSKGVEGVNIPIIYTYEKNISLGQRLDNLITDSLQILDKCKTFGLEVRSGLINNNLLVINPFSDSIKIIFSLNNAIDTQIASLQLILQKAKIDSSQLEFIDLRFDKPVVKFAPKKNG